MFSYCVRRYGFTRETAFKRIRAGRAARQFPVIFRALADGRLSLSAVVLLASHLSAESGDELLAAAMGKSKSEIEQLMAERSRCRTCRLACRPCRLATDSPNCPRGQWA